MSVRVPIVVLIGVGGVGAGFAVRWVVSVVRKEGSRDTMGCFASKEAAPAADMKSSAAQQPAQPDAVAAAPAAVAQPVRPKVTVDERDKAMLELKHNRDKLEQYKIRQSIAADKQRQTAKELLKQGRTDRAKLTMQLMKMTQNRVTEADAILMNVEKQIGALEMTQLTKDVVETIEEGNRALKELSADLSIERVELLLADTEEQLQLQNEIADRLRGSPIGAELEADVDAELEAMEQALAADKQEESAPAPAEAPAVEEVVDKPSSPAAEKAPKRKAEAA